MDDALSVYLVPGVMMLFLLFLIRNNYLFSKEQNQLFAFAAIFNIVMMLATSIDYAISLDVDSSLWMVRRFTSFLNFAGGAFVPLLLFHIFRPGKKPLLFYVPFVLNVLLCFVSMFNGLIFEVSSENSYAHGPLFLVPFLVSLVYVALLVVWPTSLHTKAKRTERIFVVGVMVVMLVCIFLEAELDFYFMSYTASSMSFAMYYLLQNINYFSRDPLTGAHNRQMFEHAFGKLETAQGETLVALLDINDFKSINDQQGHEAGDKALVKFVEVIKRHLGKTAEFYRTGGDEFMLLAPANNKEVVEKALIGANRELNQENLGFACGLAIHHPSDNTQETLRKVDRAMYRNKSTIKETTGDRRKKQQ